MSPVDQSSFDPTPPNGVIPPAPTNTAPPSIQFLAGIAVGDTIVCTTGTWLGSPTYARQWLRAGAPIAGETLPGYTLAADDLGLMIGCTVTGSNAGGSASANAAPVGPVEPAP